MTSNLDGAPIDDAMSIDDATTIRMVIFICFVLFCCFLIDSNKFQVFDIFNDEGLFLGASSCLNLCAAVELSKSLKKGIVFFEYYEGFFQFSFC